MTVVELVRRVVALHAPDELAQFEVLTDLCLADNGPLYERRRDDPQGIGVAELLVLLIPCLYQVFNELLLDVAKEPTRRALRRVRVVLRRDTPVPDPATIDLAQLEQHIVATIAEQGGDVALARAVSRSVHDLLTAPREGESEERRP